MKALFIPVSQNVKTGPLPASIIERGSCWPGCALYGMAARDVPTGHSWAFADHRNMAEIIAGEAAA